MLIEYGAEIYRVEDSLNRIAFAYGFGTEEKHMEIFINIERTPATIASGNSPPKKSAKTAPTTPKLIF